MTQWKQGRDKLTQRHTEQKTSRHNKGIKMKAAERRRGIEGLTLKKRGKAARKWARDLVTGGGILGAEMEAKRWTEEMKEARSVIDGTHPKLAGVEDKELRRRKAK